jgi:hypothetical protein
MTRRCFSIAVSRYKDTAEVPKDRDLFYLCRICGAIIPSVPVENGGCVCGNLFIDKDHWRLVVHDFEEFRLLREEQG